MKKIRKIVLAVGGSGGHIFPALSARDSFLHEGVDTLLLGKGLDGHPALYQQSVSYKEIPSGLPIVANPITMMLQGKALLSGYMKACKELHSFHPDLVIGFGSYHSLPIVLAALRKKIPLFLHEQNLSPGKVNKLFSRFAKGIGVNFSPAKQGFKCPSQEVFLPKRREKLASFKKDEKISPKICIVGGSQGAKVLNQVVPKALSQLSFEFPNMLVHHVVGPKGDVSSVEFVYRQNNIACCVKHFETHMLDELCSSDLVISRAGATILDELLWAKIPAILIPYPGAYGHQKVNAEFFVHTVHGGDMILESDLNEKILIKKIKLALDPQTNEARRQSLQDYKKYQSQKSFYQFICEHL